MGRPTAGVLYAIAIAGVIIAVDVLFFRGHTWERLAANVAIGLVCLAFYLRFRQNA